MGAALDSWVYEFDFLEPLAVQIVVLGSRSHLGLAEDKREEPMLPIPFCCREMA